MPAGHSDIKRSDLAVDEKAFSPQHIALPTGRRAASYIRAHPSGGALYAPGTLVGLAIAKCAEVDGDEAAATKNKAAQLKAYARVRNDAESQRRFAEIRLRALYGPGT